MFGSVILEIAIGVIFIYLALSLLCTAINEGISGFFSMRSRTLSIWLENFLGDRDLIANFYNNPLIRNLVQKPGKKPSYIPSSIFSATILDNILKVYTTIPGVTADLVNAIATSPIPQNLKDTLSTLARTAENKIENLKTSLEKYFDDAMDRVSGWYKRYVNNIILAISIVICGSMNIDTIDMVKELSSNSNMRIALSSYAVQSVSTVTNQSQAVGPVLDVINGVVTNTQIPFGWNNLSAEIPARSNNECWLWIEKILGIIVSAIAVSLGSPFWFNMLEQAIKLAGIEPKKA
jgi:hypothetical protein